MDRTTKPCEPLQMFELVFPGDMNAHGTMFGGRVVALMDKCAGLSVGRWAHLTPVTASIDAIQFGIPIRQGQMVEFRSQVVYVGNSSCVVRVEVYAQDIQSGDRYYCCEGYFTMVCLDSSNRPVTLPMIPVETKAEHSEWEVGKGIKQRMLTRRDASKDKSTV